MNHRVCLVIPAGRRRYLEVLIPQILREEGWDTLQIWLNTIAPEDLSYLRGLPSLDPRIQLIEPPEYAPDGNKTIGQFFRNCLSPDTVYIRFDDDVCFVEKGLVQKLAQYRAENREPFLITPVVINNAMITYVLQVLDKIKVPGNRYITANCLDEIAWNCPKFAERLHRKFLKLVRNGKIDQFKFPSRPMAINRFSINCISWLGEEFARFDGLVPYGVSEEEFLSVIKPTQLGKANFIYGDAIVSHFAFFTQREHLDQTNILGQYKRLTDDSVSTLRNMMNSLSDGGILKSGRVTKVGVS